MKPIEVTIVVIFGYIDKIEFQLEWDRFVQQIHSDQTPEDSYHMLSFDIFKCLYLNSHNRISNFAQTLNDNNKKTKKENSANITKM